MLPEQILPLNIAYEDEDLMIIDKPSGILAHPNSDETVEADLESMVAEKIGRRPTLFHRLDRETSGLLILGKTRRLNESMRKLFDEHKIRKSYLVVVEGQWPAGLNRLEGNAEDGRAMLSTCRVLKAADDWTLLEFLIKTGRRHQIRLQCKASGHPVWGDVRYGARPAHDRWIALHCAELRFTHPLSQRLVTVESKRPKLWKPEWLIK